MYNFNIYATSSKSNNADYTLKQFSELVANVSLSVYNYANQEKHFTAIFLSESSNICLGNDAENDVQVTWYCYTGPGNSFLCFDTFISITEAHHVYSHLKHVNKQIYTELQSESVSNFIRLSLILTTIRECCI
jgi:hypothetical protein